MLTCARALTFLALIALALGGRHPFTNCGGANDPVKISTATLTPDPPKKGADVTVTLAGTTSEAFATGTAVIQVFYLGIPLVNQRLDVCKLTSCPVAIGPFTGSNTISIPTIAPSGQFNATVVILDGSSKSIGCTDILFNL